MAVVRIVRTGVAIGLALLGLLGAVPDGAAQEIEPRSYSNIPVGLNFLAVGYVYSKGDVATDPSVPLEDASLSVHGTALGYVRSFALFGQSASAAVLLPYAWVSGEATFQGEPRAREVSGLADPRVRLSVNFYGAPAITLEEFADYKQDLVVGATLIVGVPLGQYESNKLVNIGTNRWSFKPEIGMSKTWGRMTLELAAGATFFTANDDFLVDKTLERAPIYSLQGHFIYSFPYGIWAAVDAVGYRGGRTTVDGVKGEDLQENVRVGLTVSFPVTRHSSIKLFGSTGVFARIGTNFNTGGILWQYRWGGGL
jgi:hypothetical protein